MKYLEKKEAEEALRYIEESAKIALSSTCERARCGSVIVKDSEIIWEWFNSPPWNLESQKKCNCLKDDYDTKITDKTCCVHAEQRAIMDALVRNPKKIIWSRLYFTRIDDAWNPKFSGQPYCTICSKMSLDSWIAEFVLYHKEGIWVYETWEYNLLSYKYSEESQ